MRKQVDLLNGPIFPTLTGLALPIMATSLVQMAYNLTDMAWVGRVGSLQWRQWEAPECIHGCLREL